MIEMYEIAKQLMHRVSMSFTGNYAEIRNDGKLLVTTENGNVENSVTIFLSGMIAGCRIISKNL